MDYRKIEYKCQRCNEIVIGERLYGDSLDSHFQDSTTHNCGDGGIGKALVIGFSALVPIIDDLDNLPIGKSVVSRLRNAGIVNIDQIKNTSNEELRRIRGVGFKTLSVIKGVEITRPTSKSRVWCEICQSPIPNDGTTCPKINHYEKIHPEYRFYFKKVITGNPHFYKGIDMTNESNYIFCAICDEKVMTYKALVRHYSETHPELLSK